MITRRTRTARGRRHTRFSHLVPLLVFVATITAIFLFGGSARADQSGVLLLRPLSVVAAGFAALVMTKEAWSSVRGPMIILASLAGMIALQLVPLPPAIWSLLPGRGEYLETYKALSMDAPWLPISQFPVRTWNALVCLVVPLSALMAYAILPRGHRELVLPLLLLFGIASGLLGIVQVLSGGDHSLYFYTIANFGSNCGFFANRNHQAVFQAALMLFVPHVRHAVQRDRFPPYVLNMLAIAAIGLLVFSIFTTGSRVGFALGMLTATWSGWKIYRLIDEPVKSKVRVSSHKFKLTPKVQKALIPAFVVALAAAALLAPQSLVLDRLMSDDAQAPIEDMRFSILQNSLEMIPDNLPFGGGAGTFPDVYKGYEKAEGISYRYVNHAHDDLLELVYEFGIGGVIFFFATLVFLVRWLLAARRTGGQAWEVAAPSAAALAIFFLGSLFDYPGRTPIGASFVILIIAWIYQAGKQAEWAETMPDGAKPTAD